MHIFGGFMKYFLKKTINQKGTYLQIYSSYYDANKKQGRNRSYKHLGYVEDLINNGISDPLSYGQKLVDDLNASLNDTIKITDISAEKNIGYFLIDSMIRFLDIKHDFNLMVQHNSFHFDLYKYFKNMCFAQIIDPGSKLKAFEKVLPSIYGNNENYSYDQVLDGMCYLGSIYSKVIELFNHYIELKFKRDYSKVFFDCTNYYFEIDLESDFQKKGPSKENRKDPIIGQALLLDANQIPITMEMYPGNESERPYIRKVIQNMKEKYNVTGKTIQVADKGLNCAKNIYEAAVEGTDGYIFSKSVHGNGLSKIEKEWVTLDNEYNKWTEVKNKDGTLHYKYKSFTSTYEYNFTNDNGEDITFKIEEKRVVTYNPKLACKQRKEIKKEVDKVINCLTFKNAGREELGDSIKYANFPKKDKNGNKIELTLNQNKIDEDLRLAGYNLLVTSETKLNEQQIYNIYHGLWKIENSFRIMKSYLDARPVFLQKEESIYGHFLICYIDLTLLRLLEKYLFNNQLSCEEIIPFIKGLNVTETREGTFINNSRLTNAFKQIQARLQLTKLDALYLNKKEILNILNSDLPID